MAAPLLLSLLVLLYCAQLAVSDTFQDTCLAFRPAVANATFELTEYVPRGTPVRLQGNNRCGGSNRTAPVMQDVCRVALNISTSARSGVQFEAWLPRNWTGRFAATGNGGIGGCVDYSAINYAVENGFAAVGSNNGHNGTSGRAFYQNPDVVQDFAERSLHTIAVAGKVVTNLFYGQAAKKSYFIGCSQGGRQGIGSAEQHPEDFDGILAGSPALDFNNLVSWRASFYPVTGSDRNPEFIRASTWRELIHDEVLRQCDELDGLKDGIVENPAYCQFDPGLLECKPGAFQNCLTTNQVNEVRRFFSPLTYDNGTIIYSGMNLGGELRATERLLSGRPFSDSQDWFRFVVHGIPSWDPADWTTRDAAIAAELNPFNIRTFPSRELQPFKDRGGKILSYHGQQDQQITSMNTERWFEHLRSGMNTTFSELDDFVRYFRISGMFHCSGGPGAWKIGQNSGQGLPFDGRYNVLAAIVEWVEQGKPPEFITGTKHLNDSVAAGIEFQRRHCRYPLRNRHRSRAEGFIANTTESVNSFGADDWECTDR